MIISEKRATLFRVIIISTLVFATSMLYFFADARYADFYPRCPFFTITGFLCPGCGSQRAISALLRGDLVQAIHFNALLVASLPLVIYSAVVSLLNVFRTDSLHLKIFYSPVFVKIFLAVVILFWFLRNISMFPFTMPAA